MIQARHGYWRSLLDQNFYVYDSTDNSVVLLHTYPRVEAAVTGHCTRIQAHASSNDVR